jgi:hypothetical protein
VNRAALSNVSDRLHFSHFCNYTRI